MDRRAADPCRFGKTTDGPSLARRQRRVYESQNAADVVAPGDRRNAAAARRIAKQALRTLRAVSTMPQRNRPHGDAEHSRDSAAGMAIARKQHDARACCDTLRRGSRSNPELELLARLGRKVEARDSSRFPMGHRIPGR
jgi:hypothetical protein